MAQINMQKENKKTKKAKAKACIPINVANFKKS
jgi:hypothetical protein